MLFYHFDQLDDFIKTDFMINLKSEKEELIQIIDLYESKKTNLLSVTQVMVEIAESIESKDKLDNFYELITQLKDSFHKINAMQELATKLQNDLITMISLYDTNLENHLNEIKANLIEYNKQRDDLSQKILVFEKDNTALLSSVITLSSVMDTRQNKKQIKAKKMDSNGIDIELNPYDNNLLVISEKDQIAYLPFFYDEIQKIHKQEKSSLPTLQDVVNQYYKIPLIKFKNSTISRFREAFQLMREKEKASITKSLDLALELMFRYELNPIVIAACRNLEELDIYLNCLDENDVYDYPCFKIHYEIMPQVTKNNKKNTF